MLDIFIGYDPREASAYHTFCDSIIRRAGRAVRITPLLPDLCGVGQRDGSNTFTYSRFLVPYLMNYSGRAIYADCDMVCLADINSVPIDGDFAVACVKHEYKTHNGIKYLGNKNRNYPRKNWSSFIVFNAAHPSCRYLTPQALNTMPGSLLHQFKWCADEDIAPLPKEWNHLVGELPPNADARMLHYTLGTPCFADYYKSQYSSEWRQEFSHACRPVPQFFPESSR